MSTSPFKRMERRIKGWFKCILGNQKQLDHILSRLKSHIHQGEPAMGDVPLLTLKGIRRSLTTVLMRMNSLRQMMGRMASSNMVG